MRLVHADLIQDEKERAQPYQHGLQMSIWDTLEQKCKLHVSPVSPASDSFLSCSLQVVNEEHLQVAIGDWITASNQPLSEADNCWLLRVFRVLNPDVPVITTSMVMHDLEPETQHVEGELWALLEVSHHRLPQLSEMY